MDDSCAVDCYMLVNCSAELPTNEVLERYQVLVRQNVSTGLLETKEKGVDLLFASMKDK